MPTTTLMHLPKTKSEDEFESICTDVLIDFYKKPFSRYGRKGQKQNGVDIFCDVDNGKRIVSQCKNYLSLNADDLIKQIEKDIMAAAEEFEIDAFVIMTAHERDTKVQDFVSEQKRKYLFLIELWFWEDIQIKLIENKELLYKHYPGTMIHPEKGMLVTLLTEARGKCLNCGSVLGIPVRGKLPSTRCEIVHITFSETEPKEYENAVTLCEGTCAKEVAFMSDDEKNALLEKNVAVQIFRLSLKK